MVTKVSLGQNTLMQGTDILLQSNEIEKLYARLDSSKIKIELVSANFSIYRMSSNNGGRPDFDDVLSIDDNTVVQRNYSIMKLERSLDPKYHLQWQFSQANPSLLDIDIDIEDAWEYTTDGLTSNGDTIVIAVIDEGVNTHHEDLLSNHWMNTNEIPNNNIDDDDNGFIDDYLGWNTIERNDNVNINGYGNWHGTPVSGIIGAEGNNRIGVSGVNRKIKIMSIVKGNDVISIIKAYDYILSMRKLYNSTNGEKGAFVVAINCSWGKLGLRSSDNPIWCSLYDSLGHAGILSIVSVPNEDLDLDIHYDMPTDCPSEFIITVTNTNQFDNKVLNAGYGRLSVDLAAPGDKSYTISNTGEYAYFGGTSAAAPYVSGTVGLLYSVSSKDLSEQIKVAPAYVANNMKRYILNGVEKISDLSNKSVSGGRLNIYNSITELAQDYKIDKPNENGFFKVINFNHINSNDGVFVKFKIIEQSRISYKLFDVHGRQLFVSQEQLYPNGIQEIEIGRNGLGAGLYFIRWSVDEKVYATRVLKY